MMRAVYLACIRSYLPDAIQLANHSLAMINGLQHQNSFGYQSIRVADLNLKLTGTAADFEQSRHYNDRVFDLYRSDKISGHII